MLSIESVTTDSGVIYTIAEQIGRGGNAEVYRCYDEAKSKEYAIKFQIKTQPQRLARFVKEQKLFNELKQHDHLIKYVDKGKYKKYPFIIMDIAEGNLTEQFKEQFNFKKEDYLAQFRGLSQALACLHQHATHRDIKPDNILVSNGRWILSDYGLCAFDSDTTQDQLTREGEKIGPAFWMSPEANNINLGIQDKIGKSSDVFQLASIFWLIVNKKHPTGILTKDDWTGPDNLFEPIFKALHYDKQIRPIDGAEFAQQIESAILS